MRSILFVCTANICRSPLAEGYFRRLLARANLAEDIEVASAGTRDYQPGKPAFPMAIEVARARGFDIKRHVARCVRSEDFERYEMILAMDKSNLADLRRIAPTRCKQKIELLLEYGDRFYGEEVPDPIGGDARLFDLAFMMIEDGCRGLAQLLVRAA